jgi:hypothetical protein
LIIIRPYCRLLMFDGDITTDNKFGIFNIFE